jgi:hypothetical protein
MRASVCIPVLIGALLLAFSAQAQTPGQTSEPEEPDYAFLTGGPFTQLKNSIQIIHVTSFATRGYPSPGGRWNADEFVFFTRTEWGFTDRLELDVITPALWSRERQGGATLTSNAGYADTILGVRYRLLREETAPITLTMGPQIILPTGSAERGTGAGSPGFAWDVSAAKDWGGPVFVFSSLNYSVLPRARDPAQPSAQRFALHGLEWAIAIGLRALEHTAAGGAKHDVHVFFEGLGNWEHQIETAGLSTGRTAALAWAVAPGLRYGFLTRGLTLTEIGIAIPIGLGPNGPKWGILVQFQFERVFHGLSRK